MNLSDFADEELSAVETLKIDNLHSIAHLFLPNNEKNYQTAITTSRSNQATTYT